jgi:hypothetical protein
MVSMDESVQFLCQISRQLNDYTDRLNGRIIQMDAELQTAGVGFPLWLEEPIEVQTSDGQNRAFYIGWAKVGEWGFHWQTPVGAQNEDAPKPLLEAPRWVRLAAFPQLKTLICRLTEVVAGALREFEPLAEDLPEGAARFARGEVPF